MPLISTMSAIAFVGCAMTSMTSPPPQGRRREVVVAGKRVKTVDIHAHCAVPAAMKLVCMYC